MSAPNGNGALVEVRDLVKHFPVRRGLLRRQVGAVQALDGLSLDIGRGETLGLVGESGSGKSTAARTILRLLEPTRGQVVFDGEDITGASRTALRAIRPRMQMIFQDPYASLNPRKTVGGTVIEALEVNRIGTAQQRRRRVDQLFDMVGLSPRLQNRYPHEFSGGQRQRIGIARALATEPHFVIADEAISALDVSIQAQIVNLLDDLKHQLELTYLFISHDLSMVRHISDRVAVLYLGKVAELGSSRDVWERPLHPYTLALLSAVPVPDPVRESQRERIVLPGDPPDPADPPSGCRFHTRCAFATDVCRVDEPALRDLGTAQAPHVVACHHAERVRASSANGKEIIP